MPNQIVLAWTVDVTNTVFAPAAAATALGAVPLYGNPVTDPVLGQFFGLTVESDAVSSGGSTATRTLTLNMTNAGAGNAPPPFPCHPRTSTPPVLPYPLRRAVSLAGSFFVSNGSMSVPTTATQIPALSVGSVIQFLSQQGVFYTVASVGATTIGLTAPYTGVSSNASAFKEVDAPVTLAALYSTSELDTVAVATVPPIAAGSGARTVSVTYKDSTGAGPFTVTVSLTGKHPVAIPLAGGSIDIAEIENMVVATSGSFGNSVGQITLAEISSAIPALPPNTPLGTAVGAAQKLERTFKTLTDEAQLLIDQPLVYLPPSYFALAQQGTSVVQLAGDFFVTTGAKDVPASLDQTGVVSPGDVVIFAAQPDTRYTLASVTAKVLKLTTEYTGIDDNNTGPKNVGTNSNNGTQGNVGTSVIDKRTGAQALIVAASPSNAQLSGPLAQFVALETATFPAIPNTVAPATVPVPTFLSDLFTRTLQLALAGVPITPATITFV